MEPSMSPVPNSPFEIRPLLIGAPVPQVTLETVDGTPFDLGAAISERPAVLIFYRGGWWPYCDLQLGQLHEIEPQLVELGFRIIAVSPDRPEKIRETLDKKPLNYLLLSDRRMLGAASFGIAFRLDDGMLEAYKGFGIDVEGASGETHHILPVPSVFITDPDGTIRFSYVNPNHRIRIDAGTLLAAARASAKR